MRNLARVLLGAMLLAAAVEALAQAWPAKPIRFVVSSAAGGTPDILARLIGERLGRATGQTVLVENRPGSANMVGAQAAGRAAPDGYTFFFATAAPLVTNQYTFKSLPYDPVKDFVPVSMVGKAPFMVLVHPSVAAKTLPELIALDRAQPGKLSFASDGPKNFSGMLGEWLNALGKTRIVQVPYNAMPQGVQDTLAGRTQVVILAIPSASRFMKSGELRALAVSSAQRAPGYEDVPPIADTFPGFDFVGWFALVAPAGTPEEIVRRANREMDAVLRDPEIVQRLRGFGIYTDGADSPEGTGEFIRAERERWGRLVREIGIQPE